MHNRENHFALSDESLVVLYNVVEI